jgi:transcriptional regulator with XRE-family HTH domain
VSTAFKRVDATVRNNRLQDPRYRAIIDRLVELRAEVGMNQRDLAERLGEPRSYVSKAENFERGLDFVQIVDWLRALGVDERKIIAGMVQRMPTARRRKN